MGKPDVDGMLRGMSSRQFAEWMAYHRLNPIIDLYDLFALLAATICNASGNFKRRFKAQDFYPKRPQTPAEVFAIFAKIGVFPKAKPANKSVA
jgi:hypothetical protein